MRVEIIEKTEHGGWGTYPPSNWYLWDSFWSNITS